MLRAGRLRISVAGLMAVVVALAVGIAVGQYQGTLVRKTQHPGRTAELAAHLLRNGRTAEAGDLFARVVERDPTWHRGYTGLAAVARREGDFAEARRQMSRALSAAESEGFSDDILACLYLERAGDSIQLMRRDAAHSQDHQVEVLGDLAGAIAKMRGSHAVALVQARWAELELALGDEAAGRCDGVSASAHYARAEEQARASLTDEDDPGVASLLFVIAGRTAGRSAERLVDRAGNPGAP